MAKQTWTVYVDTELPSPNDKFLHSNVVGLFKENGLLYVVEVKPLGVKPVGSISRKIEFCYNIKYIKQLRMKKEKKGGFM